MSLETVRELTLQDGHYTAHWSFAAECSRKPTDSL